MPADAMVSTDIGNICSVSNSYLRFDQAPSFAAIASDKPTVLEVMVTEELGDPFRRDALKKPLRMLDKYKAYE